MPDAPAPGSLPAGTRLAHYEIAGLIGAGGMGHVYRARDTKLQRDVALKLLPGDMAADPERRQRFEREARAVQPNRPRLTERRAPAGPSGPRHFRPWSTPRRRRSLAAPAFGSGT